MKNHKMCFGIYLKEKNISCNKILTYLQQIHHCNEIKTQNEKMGNASKTWARKT